MLIIDQLGMRTDNLVAQVECFQRLGQLQWIVDTVRAEHLYVHPDYAARLENGYQASLAFNEFFFPNMQLELMQVLHGACWTSLCDGWIAHFGYHTDRDQAETGSDSLFDECQLLQMMGLHVIHVSQTVSHKNTARRYRLAFASGDMTGGVAIKVIQRLLPGATLDQGRKLFARL